MLLEPQSLACLIDTAQSKATNITSISTVRRGVMGLGGSIVDVLPRHQSSRERGGESPRIVTGTEGS